MAASYTVSDTYTTFVLNYLPTYSAQPALYLPFSEIIPIRNAEDIVVSAYQPPPNPVVWDGRSIPTLVDALGATHQDAVALSGKGIRFSIWYKDIDKKGGEYVASIAQACAILGQQSIMKSVALALINGFSSTVDNGAGSTTTFFSNSHYREDGTTQDNLVTDDLTPAALDVGWQTIARWTDWSGNPLNLAMYPMTLLVDPHKDAIARLCVAPTSAANISPVDGGASVVTQQVTNPLAARNIRVENYNFAAIGGDEDDWYLIPHGPMGMSRPLKIWIQREPQVVIEDKPTEQRYEVFLGHEMAVALTAPAGGTIYGANAT